MPSNLQPIELPEILHEKVSSFWQDTLSHEIKVLLALPEHNIIQESFFLVCACSDYIRHTLQSHPILLQELIESKDIQRSYQAQDYIDKITNLFSTIQSEDELIQRLRHLRMREMIRIAWRDLSSLADLQETISDLSTLADTIIDNTLQCLHRWQCKKLGTPCDPQGNEQQMFVIALGKLGSQELNFSSDVDLIFTFPENGKTKGCHESLPNETFFLRLAQTLIKTLQLSTEDGFVYRVDMRLRPYGDSGPLVMSFAALSTYYQEQGRDWERYALLKGRIISGDSKNATILVNLLKPFVYHRYIDYGSIEALRDMKQLINREMLTRGLQQDIKRGPGGIREIEFIGQAFQLIRGGQERRLQQRKILSVLRYLKESGTLSKDIINKLSQAYIFLRNLEHRLQMVADRQTHLLPQDAFEQTRIAYAMEFPTWEAFQKKLILHRNHVETHFEKMLQEPQHEEINLGEYCLIDLHDLWSNRVNKTKALDILQTLGFTDPEKARHLLEEFRKSPRRRKLNRQSHKRLNALVPIVLQHISKTPDPLQTLSRTLRLLEAITRRSVYIALLLENPQTLQRVIDLFSQSEWITEQISSYPFSLDELLNTQTITTPASTETLDDEVRQSLLSIPEQDLEQQMDALRSFKLRQILRTAAADIMGTLPLMKVSDHLTHTAEAILHQVQEIIIKELMAKYEYSDTIHFAIIAYGKLGGIELSYSSDVDLVFLHDNPHEIEEITLRLAQRLVHMLNTRTANGIVYHVDTRLRPSGSAGLLVSHIDTFADYQKNSAWTWEHQALVRARAITGPNHLKEKFEEVRKKILSIKRDREELKESILKMRQRMHETNKDKINNVYAIKQGSGGILDIEFIVQYIVLAFSFENPSLLEWSDNIRILETATSEDIISAEQARLLIDAYQAYRDIVHRIALQGPEIQIEEHEIMRYQKSVTTIWNEIFNTA